MIVVHRRVRGIEILPKDLHFAFYDQILLGDGDNSKEEEGWVLEKEVFGSGED